ncbi:MAG TPA: tripartite tricarboxylate transporter permease [Longimicrobiales bacterium]|nr:tripartite tricarboxylate transporter permease [Longimicrobiales bacterium]
MDHALFQAIDLVLLNPYVWLVIVVSALYGTFMGAVPGLTATMAVALVVPIVYFMDPIPSMAALVTLTACALFAGDIPNALLRIPGTPASAAYTDDAYTLTQQGKGDLVLSVCVLASAFGSVFGALVLVALAPFLADVAARTFSVVEYFWLYVLGLSCAVIVSRGSLLRGLLALIIGLLLSMVGLSSVHAEARLTFGRPELYQGINFIPAMIGLFGVSEILRNMFAPRLTDQAAAASTVSSPDGDRSWMRRMATHAGGGAFTRGLPFMLKQRWHFLRSGAIGSVIGMLPGAGADIAAWVSVGASKRFARHPEEFGRGSLQAVADGSTAKSAALPAAWIPALVFAIPGDSITAIVIGILMMKNVTPGPDIFTTQAPVVYGIYLLFIATAPILLLTGILAIRAGEAIRRTPKRILLPVILVFCITGSYAINGSQFDVFVMGAMGLLGFALERRDVPSGPVILGIILGTPLEERFIQTLTSTDGGLLAFFGRPMAAVLGLLAVSMWVIPIVLWLRDRRSRDDATA